jgi:hypothetical protein
MDKIGKCKLLRKRSYHETSSPSSNTYVCGDVFLLGKNAFIDIQFDEKQKLSLHLLCDAPQPAADHWDVDSEMIDDR